MVFRRLDPEDVAQYRRLRLFGLRESPSAFGSSYKEESKRAAEAFVARLENSEDKCTIGAFSEKRLVGVVTLIRDASSKGRHKAWIYGMYVSPSVRKRGVRRELLTRAVDVAKRLRGVKQIHLAVVSSNRPALRLYESVGFLPYGEEPRALLVHGRYHAEALMCLRLKRKRPNKAPEPTLTSVMPRAISPESEMKRRTEFHSPARVTPAVSVAHL